MTTATKKPATATISEPSPSTVDSRYNAIIRANREVHKAEALWDAAIEIAKAAHKDYKIALEAFRQIVDDAPQGELFAEKGGER